MAGTILVLMEFTGSLHQSAAGSPAYVRKMDIRVLGSLEVLVAGEPIALGGQKQRGLLALLIASAPQSVSTDDLIQGVWGADAAPTTKSTLQTYVWNLRQALGEIVIHDRGSYRLEADPGRVDAVRFETVLRGSRAGIATDAGGTARRLREALGWWRGRPYADLGGVPGLEFETRRLEELRLEAVELRIDADLASGHHGDLVSELEALAAEHPTRERFRSQHMLALYRSGRQAEALRAYRRTEEYLAEELGIEPSQELQDLELRILQHDEALLSGMGRSVTQRLAFLVTDIEGSTRLWDRHPQEMAGALTAHDRMMTDAVEDAQGRIFKHTGDGVLAVFPNAGAAVRAAEAAQRALTGLDQAEVGQLRVRMGIDVGDAEARGDDFFGPPLNRAARLCSIGHGGQVLISAAAQSEMAVDAPAGLQVRHLGEVQLRGMAAPERVAQLVFVGLPADFPELRTDSASGLDDRSAFVSLPGYEVREELGEGAFGVVWRAYQPSVGREVAVKVIRPELAAQPSFVRRFEAEARTIARLAHPHIVPLIDFWRDPDRACLVLGLLPGGSLDQVIGERAVDRTQARRILEQVGSALDHAHSHGLVHGDLKPANVLLDEAQNAYLSDFGIPSRLLDPDVVSAVSSVSRYRAPEAETDGPTPPGDRYALGMLARDLFDGEGDLEPVLARATALRPSDRYPTASAFLADLTDVLGQAPEPLQMPAVSRNPYKGLRPFDEADAADFYGRDDLVAALMAAVERHRFVTVVGPSGSGKSSVVRAGLLPQLAAGAVAGSDRWYPVVFTPGEAPLEALTAALHRVLPEEPSPPDRNGAGLLDGWPKDADLLLVIDQFEEIYTQVDDVERRGAFIDLLVSSVQAEETRLRVVATLRADFYDRPLADDRLGALVKEGQVTVLPPSREDYVEMVASPAQAVGLRWEPGLPHRIAEDVAHQSGALPLLQYALTELVERRSGDLLTDADYSRIGGVAGALAGRAEAVYQNLTPPQQEAARQVLLRLVAVDEESDDTRRRVRRSELESLGLGRADLEAVLDTFVTERLLLADRDPVTRGPTLEVAHEALLREWPRLAGWIDDQRESLVLGRRFRAALTDWETSDRHADYLLVGNRLAPFTGWAETAALTPEERDYYLASRARDETDRAARRRRRRTLVGVLAGAAVVASVLGVVAAIQAGRATAERDRALAAEGEAESQAIRAEDAAAEAETSARLARARELGAAADAALDSDPVLAKLLGLSALEVAGGEPGLDLRATLRRALDGDRVVDEYTWPADHEVNFFTAHLHPTLPRLVAGGEWPPPSPYMEVYDLEAEEVVWSYESPHRDVVVDSPRFTPDGSRVVASLVWMPGVIETDTDESVPSDELGVWVFDAESGEAIDRIPLDPRCGGFVLGVSESSVLVGYSADEEERCTLPDPEQRFRIELIDLSSGERREISPGTEFAYQTKMSGDGRYVGFVEVAPDDTTMTVVMDVVSGERVLEFDIEDHEGVIQGWPLAFNHDGSLMIAGDRPMAVWDVAAGRMVASFSGHTGDAWPAFSPDGESVFSMGREGTLRAWSARRGTQTAAYPSIGTAGPVSVSSDETVLIVDRAANVARLVNGGLFGEKGTVATCGGSSLSHSLVAAGGRAVVAEICPDGAWTSFFVDLEAGQVLHEVPSRSQVQAISPDGTRMVGHSAGEPLPPGTPGSDFGGHWVGPLTVHDVETGRPLLELEGHCTWGFNGPADHCTRYPDTPFLMWAWKLAWAPDGRYLAAVNNGSAGESAAYVVVWDLSSGAIVADHRCSGRANGVVFAPDANEMVVSCDDGELVGIDTGTWTVQRTHLLDPSVTGRDAVGFIGYGAGGRTLMAVGGDAGGGVGELLWIDTDTFSAEGDPLQAFTGSPK